MRVVRVRNGETAWSRAGRHTGRTDVPLLDEGARQRAAADLGERERPQPGPDQPGLARARETCALAGFADQAVIDPDLMEWDYGAYEGRRAVDIRVERPGWDLFTDGTPGGETYADVAARVERVMASFPAPADGATADVALFAHGHLLRVLAARWLELGPAVARALLLSPTTISVLGRDRGTPVVALWNDASHLES